MSPFYLRFANKAEAEAAMAFVTGADRYGLDVIGESMRDDATFDASGNMLTPATQRSGYFVNWIGGELPVVLVPYATEPVTPFRVFAGWSPEEIAAREAKPK